MKYRIFVSGVQKELKTERRIIKSYILGDALFSEYFNVFLFEDAPAKSKSAENIYLEEVKKCDIYIGILGNKYGGSDKAKISPTEAEFKAAKNGHKVILIYIKGNSSNDKKRELDVQKLIKKIRDSKKGFSYKRFSNVSEFRQLVYASLIEFLKEEGIVGRGTFEDRICKEANLADINEAKVRWFQKVARNTRKFPLNQKASIEDILTHLKLLQNKRITNAAILLFASEPSKFFNQANIKCIHIPSTKVEKPFSSYHIYEGNLFEQVDKAVGFVLDIIKQAVIQQKHTPQFKRPFEIPVFAISEAIVNALVHRNYNTKSSVQVIVFLDRIEVWNSGTLPKDLSVEDLKRSHASHPHNPLLARTLYLADYIQQVGSGTLEMVKQCNNQRVPEPEFALVRNVEFRTILPRNTYPESFLQKAGISERQRRAVELVRKKVNISLSDLREVYTEITRRTLSRDLQDLVDKGIFKAHGDKKGRKYSF